MTSRAVLAVVFLAMACGLPGCSGQPGLTNNGTNVLLIVMDTVRSDKLSCYGNPRNVTQMVDVLAERGVRFENFFTNASWTLPAHASLFTGVYSVGHRATQETLVLDDEYPTLSEIMGMAGYQTFGSSTNGVVSAGNGLARGFDEFVHAFRDSVREELGAAKYGHPNPNNLAFERFLARSDRQKPFFVFLNYVDAHAPYVPPEPVRSEFVEDKFSKSDVTAAMNLRMADHYMYGAIDEEQFELLTQLYEGEINLVDRAINNIYATLQKDGRLANTLIIVTSDHGENLGDHDHFAHVFSIHNTLLEVPLVVVFPGGSNRGVVRHDTAQLLDLFPTILRLCGVGYEGRWDGRNLFEEGAESRGRYAMAEYYYPRQVLSVFDPEELAANVEKFEPFMKRFRALQDDQYKLIWASDGSRELYRIDIDPGEVANLLLENPSHPALAGMVLKLERMVEAYQGDTPLDPPPPVGWLGPGFEERIQDPELLRKLRSLGYVK